MGGAAGDASGAGWRAHDSAPAGCNTETRGGSGSDPEADPAAESALKPAPPCPVAPAPIFTAFGVLFTSNLPQKISDSSSKLAT
jgi:hypothetical protein